MVFNLRSLDLSYRYVSIFRVNVAYYSVFKAEYQLKDLSFLSGIKIMKGHLEELQMVVV